MSRKPMTEGEALMRTRLQNQLFDADRRNGKEWKHPSGKLFRFAKGCYYVLAVYSFFVFLLNECIFLLMKNSHVLMNDGEQTFFRVNYWLVHGMFFLSVVAFVLMLLKKTKFSCWLQVMISGLVGFQVVQIFVGGYHNRGLLATLYLIILFTLFTSLTMLLIYYFEHKQLEKAVSEEYNSIYKQFAGEDAEMLTPERLEQIMLERERSLSKDVAI
jgi:hypothetical protein